MTYFDLDALAQDTSDNGLTLLLEAVSGISDSSLDTYVSMTRGNGTNVNRILHEMLDQESRYRAGKGN